MTYFFLRAPMASSMLYEGVVPAIPGAEPFDVWRYLLYVAPALALACLMLAVVWKRHTKREDDSIVDLRGVVKGTENLTALVETVEELVKEVASLRAEVTALRGAFQSLTARLETLLHDNDRRRRDQEDGPASRRGRQ